jgi:hypothetical protein
MMDEAELLKRFGFSPAGTDLPQIRDILRALTKQESDGGHCVNEMRVCCVQLFNAGHVEDSLEIWDAKRASMDAGAGIDVQLLCGAGLAETKSFLASLTSENAAAALAWIRECEAAGDFEDFSVADWSDAWRDYYESASS